MTVAPEVLTVPAVEEAPETPGPPPPEVEPRRRGTGRLRSAASTLGWTIVGMATFVGLWQLVAIQSPDVPSPAESFGELVSMLASPFYNDGPNDQGVGLLVFSSLKRVVSGFVLAVVAGVPLGMLLGASRRAWDAANPIVQFLRPVSPLAWFPIVLFALKDAEKASVWVIFITALWPITLNTAAGASSVPRDQRAVAKVFKFGRWNYIRHILFPHTLPSIVTGMRLSMGIGWMVIVAVEMLSAVTGIGNSIWIWYNGGDLPKVAAGIILVGAVGLVLDLLFLRLGRAVAIEEVEP